MKLKGIEFGNVFAASGTLNFFGDGWWYHIFYMIFFFFSFRKIKECTFVSKTTTWAPRAGNMPLKKNLQPKELLPKCIKIYPFKGIVLNAVGLSGPGAEYLFAANIWQQRTEPFFISFMAVGDTEQERLEETKKFISLFQKELPNFHAPVGAQVNRSCPNTGHSTKEFEKETLDHLKLFSVLGIPIDLKINVLFDIELIKEIEANELCDVITMSNTIPYGACPEWIDWDQLLGRPDSPLKEYGGGGLSGRNELAVVLERIRMMRQAGITKKIKGSGGIMCANDVIRMHKAGVNCGIEFATASMIRPWLVKEIVETAKNIFKDEN